MPDLDDFPVDAADRSPGLPRYRLTPDGGADALVVVPLSDTGSAARVVREDGGDPIDLVPADAGLPDGLAEVGATVPTGPLGVAVVPVPAGGCVTYRVDDGDGAPRADPCNHDSAGPLASLLTHPDALRAGPGGIDAWRPRPPDSVSALPPIRVRLDPSVLGRRCTVRMTAPVVPGRTGNDAGTDQAIARIPVVLVLDGDDWIDLHDLGSALRAVLGVERMPVLVHVPALADRADRAAEMTGDRLVAALRGPVLAAVDRRLSEDGLRRGDTLVAGQSLSGLPALRTGYAPAADGPRHGIDAVLAQSPSFWWPAPESGDPLDGPAGGDILTEITAAVTGLRVFLSVGEAEPAMHRHVDAVAAALSAAGAVTTSRRVPGGHDHAVWRGTLLADIVTALRR